MTEIIVSGDKLANLKRLAILKIEKSAIERECKTLQASLDLPKPEEVSENAQYILKNGNGDIVAKFTIFWRDGYSVAGSFCGRLA
jgi:hypothetical protein